MTSDTCQAYLLTDADGEVSRWTCPTCGPNIDGPCEYENTDAMTDELTKEDLDELERLRDKSRNLNDPAFSIHVQRQVFHHLNALISLARAHLEARESGEGLVGRLRDMRDPRPVMSLRRQAADALAAMKAEMNKWKQPYVHCFTCGTPAHKVIHLPEGCAALPDVSGIVGICSQHEYSIEPHEQYHVLCDFSATTPDQLAAKDWEIVRLRAALGEIERCAPPDISHVCRTALGKDTDHD